MVSGLCHLIDGSITHAQWSLVQLKRSKAPDNAYVSEARVLATTLAIFFEYHDKGLTLVDWTSLICFVVARIIHPFWELAFSCVANAASENDMK